MKPTHLLAVAATAALFAAGCGNEGKIQPQDITIKDDNPLKRATNLLESYAKGQPLGSEVSTYDKLVTDLKAMDADRGQALEKGLEELKKTKGEATKAKAKEILAKLAPKMNAG